MAHLGRAALGFLVLAVALSPASPPAAAQEVPRTCDTGVCATTVELTVEPTGAWDDDGFLDDEEEIATYDVTARALFENSFCATPNDILFQMYSTEFARSNITPARHTVDIPFQGGEVTVRSQLQMYLLRGTPPMRVEGIILRVIVQDCGLGGAQARAEANLTVAVVSEIRPRMDVEFQQPDLRAGTFNMRVLNSGNANLIVDTTIHNGSGAAPTDAILPAPTRVDVGDVGNIAVLLPDDPPGNYTITLTGRWAADPANATLPRAEYVQRASIEVPPPAPAQAEDAPAPALAALATALLATLLVRRRIRF